MKLRGRGVQPRCGRLYRLLEEMESSKKVVFIMFRPLCKRNVRACLGVWDGWRDGTVCSVGLM